MRIAMFTDSYRPQINGMVTSIDLFTRSLRSMGHEVHIFTPAVPETKYSDRFVHAFKSVEFPSYKEYRIGFPLAKSFDSGKGFDVVHVHSVFSMGVAGIVYAKYKGIPSVGTFHTMFSDYLHYFIKFDRLLKNRKFKRFAEKMTWKYLSWFYNRCDVVVSPSKEMVPVLKKHGIKKIVFIPTGIDTSSNSRFVDVRKKYGLSRCSIILHVGRVTKEKNIDFILKALEKPLKKSDGIKFVIASDGPHRAALESRVKKLGLQDKVIFTGYVSEEELDSLYKESDVFVMASRSETQGLVLLEAVKRTLPVVVADAPIISDFVAENSVGIVSRNFSSDVMKMVADRRARERFRNNCRRTLKKYDINRCTRQLLGVYSSLSSSREGSPG